MCYYLKDFSHIKIYKYFSNSQKTSSEKKKKYGVIIFQNYGVIFSIYLFPYLYFLTMEIVGSLFFSKPCFFLLYREVLRNRHNAEK